MNDITTARMLLTTAVLAAVAALFAGGANAMLQDVEGGSGSGGSAAAPLGSPGTIPYLSHGIGVDKSLFSGQASSKVTDEATPGAPGTIPYLSHGIGVDKSLFSGQATSTPSGVHAALQRDLASPPRPSPLQRAQPDEAPPWDRRRASQFNGQTSLGLTGDSPLHPGRTGASRAHRRFADRKVPRDDADGRRLRR